LSRLKNGLDQTNIRARLEQMRGKAVPQRVQGDGLLDPRGVRSVMEKPAQLAGG